MESICLTVRRQNYPSDRQKWLRRRFRHVSLRRAVSRAANAVFRFRYRAIKTQSLWSVTERVWLGRETFLHWALSDAGIDIPWLVAESRGVPIRPEELRATVAAELAAYWKRQLTALPRRGSPYWLPLP